MNGIPDTIAVDLAQASSRALRDFLALTKPRMVSMVLVATAVGFYLGSIGAPDYALLLETLLGTALAAGGTLALNQYLERDLDARMERTRERPLPSGRLQPVDALAFGASLASLGLLLLALHVNPLSGLVTAVTVVTYLFVYTPMKRRSPLCSVYGAVPGALPPVTGWVAATGDFGLGAWILFSIVFLWQLPHSLAIAKLYVDDYERAGFRMLPVVDRAGRSTERQILSNCVALLAVGLSPSLFGLTGSLYFVSALILGCGLLLCGISLARSRTAASARRLLFASLIYLPLLLAFMAIDKA